MQLSFPSPSPDVLKRLRLTWLCSLLLLAPLACDAGLFTGPNWRPVTPEEQAMTAPQVDADAGVEILFKDVVVENRDREAYVDRPLNDDADNTRVYFRYYLRLKVFDARGVDQLTSFDIDIDEETLISDFAARVIQPDGSIIESGNDDLIKRDIVIVDNDRKRRYSLPISGLVPGSIVDIQWQANYKGFAHNEFFIISDFAPIQKARIEITPDPRLRSCFYAHNITPLVNKGKGCWVTEAENIPCVPDEAWHPSPKTLQTWVFLSYAWDRNDLKTENSWENYSSELWDMLRFRVRDAGSEVKRMAAQLTQGVDDRNEKLSRLYYFCADQISNLNATGSGYTSADMQEMDEDSDVAEVLKNRRGFAYEINMLFAALAHEAGFEVKLAGCNDRTYIEWDISHSRYYMIPVLYAAVRNGENWDFYCPGVPNLPCGKFYFGNEGTVALLSDKDKAAMIVTPESPSSYSQIVRSGNFTLDEEGTLSGEGSFEYSGHHAFVARDHFAGMLPDGRIEGFKEEIARLVPSADISNVVFENLDDPEKNLIIRFSLNCAAYADVADERIFLQPGVYQKNEGPLFPSEIRHTDIRFQYFWETSDKVKIRFPDGFELEDGAAPMGIVNTPQIAHVVKLGLSRQSPTLIYMRGMKIAIRTFPMAIYADIKAIFDAIHQEDQHVVSLRRKAVEPEAAPQPDAASSQNQ